MPVHSLDVFSSIWDNQGCQEVVDFLHLSELVSESNNAIPTSHKALTSLGVNPAFTILGRRLVFFPLLVPAEGIAFPCSLGTQGAIYSAGTSRGGGPLPSQPCVGKCDGFGGGGGGASYP